MAPSSTTVDDYSRRKRFAIYPALMVAAILVITACTAGSDAPSSALLSGGPLAAPTTEVADENLSDPEPAVGPGPETESSADQIGPGGKTD